jgi:DNA-binding GntR family transcriptional regulator
MALAALREDIVSGALRPGTPIRLNKYVEQLQMSAVPIREALRFLEQRGLIDRSPHKGVFVAEMSARDLEDTYRIRLELESLAVREAVRHMTPELAQVLQGLVDEYSAATMDGPNATTRELHERLHMTLYSLSQSKWLTLLLPPLWDNSERYRRLSLPRRGTPEQRVREHVAIVEACIAGDGDRAEQLLREHLGNSFEAAVASLQTLEQAGVPDSRP